MSKESKEVKILSFSEKEIELDLKATQTGNWAFMTRFNGAYQYVEFEAIEGENIVIPIKLNSSYTYIFKLYKPDYSMLGNTEYKLKTPTQSTKPKGGRR